MSEVWGIIDSRTGRPASVACFGTEERAALQIAGWVARDARGGRPDCHETIPFLVPKLINLSEGE